MTGLLVSRPRVMRTILVLPMLIGCVGGGRDARRASATDSIRVFPVSHSDSAPTPWLANRDSGVPPFDSSSVHFGVTGRPIVPITLRYECEGEDCMVQFPAVTCKATSLRAAAADSAPVVTHLVEGDTLDVPRRDAHVTKVGIVVVRKSFVLDHALFEDEEVGPPGPRSDTVRLARGDTIFLLDWSTAGHWFWTHRSTLHEGHQFWSDPPGAIWSSTKIDSTFAAGHSEPVTEDWWYVRPKRGGPGWWHNDGRGSLWSISDMVRLHDDCPKDADAR